LTRTTIAVLMMCLTSVLPPAAAPPAAAAEEKVQGIGLELLAELLARQLELRTRVGEKQGNVDFEKLLADRGFTKRQYDMAYAAWWERFKADRTGKLEADFHTREAEWSRKLNFGDVPDLSQTAREGVTLEQYARIVAGMTQPGAKPEAVVKAAGLKDMAAWERANKAWGLAMGQDTSMRLVVQYGELYKKFAGPAFEAEQKQKLAEMLAEGNRRNATPPSATKPAAPDLSPETLARRLTSQDRDDRWDAARWMALRHCSARSVKPSDKEAMARCAATVPVLLDMLDHHDDATISSAADAATQLENMVGGRTRDTNLTVMRCLNRARARLEVLRLSFAPIQDKAVPERIVLQTRIQEYEALERQLDRMLKAWPR
jgi:hypothetical protein